jgi:hypothetical protein
VNKILMVALFFSLVISNATPVIPPPTNTPTLIIAFSNTTHAVHSNQAVDLASEYEKYQKGQIAKGQMMQ